MTTTAPDGSVLTVHVYAGDELGEDYSFADIVEAFGLGCPVEGGLEFTRKELRDLLNFANAYSFDHPEGFIEMCLEVARTAATLPGEKLVFHSDF
ncbi:MAG: hypothetical protein O9320_17495 [Magnetospirillum sp.]|nr:hypothetical protein [Magnetospirillum sp.]